MRLIRNQKTVFTARVLVAALSAQLSVSNLSYALDTVTVSPVTATASGTPATSPSLGPVDPDKLGLDATCDPILAKSDLVKTAQDCSAHQARDPSWQLTTECKRAMTDSVLKDPSTSKQLEAFCQEAKAARNALGINKSLSKTWFAVSASCFLVCSQPWGQTLCTVGAGVATVEELMKGAQIQQLFMSLMGGMALGNMVGARLASSSMVTTTKTVELQGPTQDGKPLMGKTNVKVSDPNKEAQQKKQKSCYTTATFALLQGFLKQQGLGAMQSTYDNAWQQIKNLYGTGNAPSIDPVVSGVTVAGSAPITNGSSGTTSSGSSGLTSGSGDTVAAANKSGSCGSVSGSDSGAMISCAVSKDSSIPPIATDPRFADAFQAKTGTSLADFMKNPSGMSANDIGNAFGGGDSGRSSEIASNLKSAAASMDPTAFQNLGDAGGGAGYAQGRGGSPSRAAAESGPDFAKLMEGALGGFGRKPASADDASSKELDLSAQMQNKSAEQIAQDTRISIFDRVSYRYKVTSSRLVSP